MNNNAGYDPKEIQLLQEEMATTGNPFLFKEDLDKDDSFAEFLFIGKYEGKPVVFDCILFQLSMAYENKLLEMAEDRAREHNPKWAEIIDEGDENDYPEDLEDFIAYTLVDLEEEEAVLVQEQVIFDTDFEYGIGLEVSLNRDVIDAKVISEFITAFNDGTFEPDPTLYSFEEEAEDED